MVPSVGVGRRRHADLPLPGGGGGGMAAWALPPDPTPPTSEIFTPEKNEIYQRGPKLEVNLRHTNSFLASDPQAPV